jgi:hypothetical protein
MTACIALSVCCVGSVPGSLTEYVFQALGSNAGIATPTPTSLPPHTRTRHTASTTSLFPSLTWKNEAMALSFWPQQIWKPPCAP